MRPVAESTRESSPLEFAVLQRRADIEQAKIDLEERDLLPPRPRALRLRVAPFARRLGFANPTVDMYPDPVKSWDVLRTIEAVCSSVGSDDPVLDVGSVASAVLPCLHSLGYRKLSGIDLDERVHEMFHSEEIHYSVEDLTRTRWPDRSFAAVTAISVIEHGIEDQALLAEIARLLRPGGLFVFSTDYWPDKVRTHGKRLFGLPWRIFSAKEIEALLDQALTFGLRPTSDPRRLIQTVDERAIRFKGLSYTFLYGVLVRT